MAQTVKPIIYQLLPRLFGNQNTTRKQNGTIKDNGCGKFNDITSHALRQIKAMGITHVWYTGIIEHATKTDYSRFGITPCNPHVVKGNAGSPYAIRDYYDVDPDLAVDVSNRIGEFEELVDRTHKEGLRVIVDFVPNHVAREYASDQKPVGVEDLGASDNKSVFFQRDNNFYYIVNQQFKPSVYLGECSDEYVEFPAKATGNDCFNAFPSECDWYETIKLNYGIDYSNGTSSFFPIPSTWWKMLDILKFWTKKGVDGFRCDMAHMVPIEFWQWVIPQIKSINNGMIFIAEIYNVDLYRRFIYEGNFDYLYDKVTLYDTLRNITCANVSAAAITNCWQTIEGIQDHMLNFLENHDEQRVASSQFALDPLKALPAAVVSATISRCPFMIYFGQELGEKADDSEGFSGRDGRTTIFDYWSVPTVSRWYNGGKCNSAKLDDNEKQLREFYARLLTLCNSEKAISQGDFFDLMYVNYQNLNPHRQYVYLRHYRNETLLVAVNFDFHDTEINISIPQHAFDCCHITMGEYDAVDLLAETPKSSTMLLSSISKTHLALPRYGAKIIKLTRKMATSANKKASLQ